MAKKVTNLRLYIQSGTDNTLVAAWDFNPNVSTPNSKGVKVGDWVKIKPGSKWYNGVSIDSWIFNHEWKVIQVNGARAVLGKNRSGSNNIQSPINVNNLIGGSGGGSSTTQNTLSYYVYTWFYDTGDGIWYIGKHSDKDEAPNNYVTYNPPSNATRIHFHIYPVSKTRKVNGKEQSYWTGEIVKAAFLMAARPPEKPPTPTVKIEKYDLTATVDNISDPRSDEIAFQVYDQDKFFCGGHVAVKACVASYKCKVNAGGNYRVRARSANEISKSEWVYSDWSNFSSSMTAIPSVPSAITKIRGSSSTSIYLEWATVNSAKTYDIEYTTKIKYFDGSNETKKITGIEFNHYEVTGLQSGEEYFFRVRAVNEKGESGWSEIKSVVIGKKPSAPTTWSSATTVITGDTLNLYWVHNAEDGSKERYAEVEITVGTDTQTYTVKNETAEDDEAEEKTKFYSVDTSKYNEGTQIKWRVRTAGITTQYGDWSIMRVVDIYAPPTLELSVTNQNGDIVSVVDSFPFYIKGLAGPSTQMPIGYHVSIIANEGYQTVDYIGRTKIVNSGEAVYSKYIDTNDPLLVKLSANSVDLDSDISYTVSVTASMNSGLTADASLDLGVSWTGEDVPIDAEIAIDDDSFIAYITPYCRNDDGTVIPDISLAVYRREFDGTFKEIASGLDSTKNTVVTDPHPALDYARYRIVATSNETGAVSYYDPPGYPIGATAVIIQWDEEWTDFEVTNIAERAVPSWSGSFLKLLYNVDVSENNKQDSTLVSYIGRSYPVSYYGTQIDSSATWNVDVPKSDKETIYALRRLSIWKGDAYVREPSGSGYWANVNVSFSQKHTNLVVPVTLSIKRVEGGV